jgi:hypothetical protein
MRHLTWDRNHKDTGFTEIFALAAVGHVVPDAFTNSLTCCQIVALPVLHPGRCALWYEKPIVDDSMPYRCVVECHASAFLMHTGPGTISHVLAGKLRGLGHQPCIFSLAHFLGSATTERPDLEPEEGVFLVLYHLPRPCMPSVPYLPLSYRRFLNIS